MKIIKAGKTQKKMVEVEETINEIVEEDKEGLMALLGEQVLLMCANYFYSGKLVGVNQTMVKLENASVVFETGSFVDSKYKDSQKMSDIAYVNISHIESAFKSGKSI
jgi:hypothetical protein